MKKEDKNRLLEPASEHKETYLKIIGEQINSLSKFILEQTKILDTTVPLSRIEKEIKTLLLLLVPLFNSSASIY